MSTPAPHAVELAYLRIPLSLLEWQDPALFTGLSPERVRRFREDYEPDEVDGILGALRAAVAMPAQEWARLDVARWLPHGVVVDAATVQGYLARMLRSLSRDAAGAH